jgi:hypothetical protein
MGDDPYRANKRFPERNPSAIDPDNPEVFSAYPSYVIGRAKMIVLPSMLSEREDEAALPAMVGVEESNAVASWVEKVNPDLAHVRNRKTQPMPLVENSNGDIQPFDYQVRRWAGFMAFADQLRRAGAFEGNAQEWGRFFGVSNETPGFANENLSSDDLTMRIVAYRESKREATRDIFHSLGEKMKTREVNEIARRAVCLRSEDGPRTHERLIDELLKLYDDGRAGQRFETREDFNRWLLPSLGYCVSCRAIRFPVAECLTCGERFEKTHGNQTRCKAHRRNRSPRPVGLDSTPHDKYVPNERRETATREGARA